MRQLTWRLGQCAVLAVLVWVVVACGQSQPSGGSPGYDQPARDFTLSDQNGQPFRLADQRGKTLLLNFGYTNCPDVCPIALAQLAQVRQKLGPDAARVQVVFVTTDPARDRPPRLKEFLANFDPTFVGLTGPDQALRQVWQDYGIRVSAAGSTTASGAPNVTTAPGLIDHSSLTYLIDAQGVIRGIYPSDYDADMIVTDVRKYLKS